METIINRNKKVSIIIPCYNAERYIAECLESIFAQKYGMDDVEIIVIDDLSIDNTKEIVFAYEKKYTDNLMFITLEEHTGLPGMVRNIALNYASGEYVVFLDSDDLLEPEFLGRMIDAITTNGCDIVTCGYTMFNETGNLESDIPIKCNYDLNKEDDRKLLICNEGTRTSVWARIYRNLFIKNNNIKFSDYYHIAEDMFFWHSCLMQTTKVVSISDSLYKYRIKHDSLFHKPEYNYAADLIECAASLSKRFIRCSYLQDCSEEYAAVIFSKCGFELLGYLDTHATSDEMFEALIAELRNMLRIYWSDLPNNKYLNADSVDLAKQLIG